jgi:hypothetical protein
LLPEESFDTFANRMIQMKTHFLLLFVSISFLGLAQEPDTLIVAESEVENGKFTVNVPFSLEELEARYIRLNEKTKKTNGYRIQFYSGSRQGANDAKVELLTSIDDQEVYVLYQQPYFKTKIGDFRTKLEAEKYMRELGETCRGCFVVREEIEFPKLD